MPYSITLVITLVLIRTCLTLDCYSTYVALENEIWWHVQNYLQDFILLLDWRRLHNEELNYLYSSSNIVRVIKSRRMRWAGLVGRMGEERGVSWWGNRRERDNWGDLGVDGWIILCWICRRWDWIGLAQDRDRWRTLVGAKMNLRVPWNAGNFLTSCKPSSCSGRTLHHGVSIGIENHSCAEYFCTRVRLPQDSTLCRRLV